ncbi:hypothetical protein BDF19DRAFT_419387 [Syncephalis fuscata]|nr:hypothetical protein BDF19DRAFT_419387 [Syncephalis fuscata]
MGFFFNSRLTVIAATLLALSTVRDVIAAPEISNAFGIKGLTLTEPIRNYPELYIGIGKYSTGPLSKKWVKVVCGHDKSFNVLFDFFDSWAKDSLNKKPEFMKISHYLPELLAAREVGGKRCYVHHTPGCDKGLLDYVDSKSHSLPQKQEIMNQLTAVASYMKSKGWLFNAMFENDFLEFAQNSRLFKANEVQKKGWNFLSKFYSYIYGEDRNTATLRAMKNHPDLSVDPPNNKEIEAKMSIPGSLDRLPNYTQ